jgi:alpha-beta hydrolase superfamily lysophospholipase
MRRIGVPILGLVLASMALAEPKEIQFVSAGDVTVYGDVYLADAKKSAPLILLFHQGGGDARGEYSGIAERLTQNGYHALAIDQRAGGERFDSINRTVAGLDGKEFGYCDAYADLEAAISYANETGFSGPVVAWGSSYSAALVFRLAVEHHDELVAALAFSPAAGAPLADCQLQPYVANIRLPMLALRPQSEYEIDSVKVQMAEFAAQGIQTYVADPGVHGSSMLNAERVGAPTEATWTVVLEFLDRSLAGN